MKATVSEIEKFGSPTLELRPDKGKSCLVLLLHGYGGCKEEMLPIATKLNMLGYVCYIPDLPGHGKNKQAFCLDETEVFIDKINSDFVALSETTIIGHSVGALIAFNTNVENVVSISPPVPQIIDFEGSKTKMLKTLRVRRVIENAPFAGLREILNKMHYPAKGANSLIVHAKNDLSSIIENSKELSKKYACALKIIQNANHNDIVSANQTTTLIIEFLNKLI